MRSSGLRAEVISTRDQVSIFKAAPSHVRFHFLFVMAGWGVSLPVCLSVCLPVCADVLCDDDAALQAACCMRTKRDTGRQIGASLELTTDMTEKRPLGLCQSQTLIYIAHLPRSL